MREFFKPTRFKIIFSVGFIATVFFILSIANQQDPDGVLFPLFYPLFYVAYGLAWYLGPLPNILGIPILIVGVYALACLIDFITKSIKSLIAKP